MGKLGAKRRLCSVSSPVARGICFQGNLGRCCADNFPPTTQPSLWPRVVGWKSELRSAEKAWKSRRLSIAMDCRSRSERTRRTITKCVWCSYVSTSTWLKPSRKTWSAIAPMTAIRWMRSCERTASRWSRRIGATEASRPRKMGEG